MQVAVKDVDIASRTVSYTDSSGVPRREQFDLIIGTDGRNSAVREAMQASNKGMRVDMVPNDQSYISFCGLRPLEGCTPVPILLCRRWCATCGSRYILPQPVGSDKAIHAASLTVNINLYCSRMLPVARVVPETKTP